MDSLVNLVQNCLRAGIKLVRSPLSFVDMLTTIQREESPGAMGSLTLLFIGQLL